jgi:hypothetical protein
VTFRYKDWREGSWKTTTLSSEEFVPHYLQHVFPRRFHKVRFYGLLAPGNRPLLGRARILLSKEERPTGDHPVVAPEVPKPEKQTFFAGPHWRTGRLIPVGSLLPEARGPS